MLKNNTDIIIVGGGLSGLCIAAMLGQLKFNIILIDKQKITKNNIIHKDTRTVAISLGTKQLFQEHGLWSEISNDTQPIKKIHVLNRDSTSKILFKKNNKDPMGYIIKHDSFKRKLIKKIKNYKNSVIMENEIINKIDSDLNNISISTKNNIFIKSKLLIAADGKNSFIRNFYNLPSYKIRYDQSALVVNFQHSKNHKNTAFEIFLPNGPLATLPMKSNKKNIYKSSMIWSEKTSIVRDLNQLNSNYLKDIIEEKIYPYLGKIKNFDTFKIFDLNAHMCRKFFFKRVALIGDSAHSIHPIAGQGWNLGVRDIKYLIESLNEYRSLGLDLGSLELLKNYNDNRFTDVSSMLFITHSLNKIFLSKSKFVNSLRSLGFDYINSRKKITNSLVNYAMGVNL